MVRTTSIRPVLDSLERMGVRPTQPLEQARPLLHDPNLLIPVSYGGFLFAEAQRSAAIEDFGVRLGQMTRLVDLGAWGTVVRETATVAGMLRSAMTTASRFNSGERFWAGQIGGDVWFYMQMSPRITAGRSVVSEFVLLMMIDAVRLGAGPEWRPTEIHMEGPPRRYAEEIAAYATKQVFFERPYTAIVFAPETLALRFPKFPPAPAATGPIPATEFESACRQVVEALLRLGATDLSAAAEMARMSERSLQRGLATRGYTFKRLVEEVRFETAVKRLHDPQAKIVEIANDLGYTDSANFTRAFRRWAGVPPRAFRSSV